ncbi:hypothetical protein A7Q03_03015 [Eikenella sp. NML99-0057]|nr:hypothetical protein A7Q03_03015 [Eikenella sp. NML99-0057]
MPRLHLYHLMRIKTGMVFLPQADQSAQAGHVEVHIQPLPVALRTPNGFGQRVHHIVFGAYPVASITALQLMVDGADAGRLVDVALFLYRKVQRQMQEGIGLALLRRPVAARQGIAAIRRQKSGARRGCLHHTFQLAFGA